MGGSKCTDRVYIHVVSSNQRLVDFDVKSLESEESRINEVDDPYGGVKSPGASWYVIYIINSPDMSW